MAIVSLKVKQLAVTLKETMADKHTKKVSWRKNTIHTMRVNVMCATCGRLKERPMEASNIRAMREALKQIHDRVNSLDEDCSADTVEIRDIARSALSAPPRNCDRPECATTKSAQKVWRKEDGGKTAYYEWLLATSTEGDAK